jgi:putative two-component system response regulator
VTRNAAEIRPQAKTGMPPPVLPHEHILVVDDEAPIRKLMLHWLRAEGCSCRDAGDAREALDRLAAESYALVLSDIAMPGLSGLEFLAAVRRRFPDVAVVMVTGANDRKTALEALQRGAYGYVIKPLQETKLWVQVASALERRRLDIANRVQETRLNREVHDHTAALRRREEEIALRLVAASEYRDEDTGAHIRRIGLYAATIGKALGWDRGAADDIRVAAPMHDIGKIGVPDGILFKTGRLSREEFEVVKTHTLIGDAILDTADVPLLRMARTIALAHHEKWDASGYPHGRGGEDIPESARIVAVIDVYDALVHDRVYRAAMPEKKALDIMKAERGTHFEPRIFDCFLSVLPELRRIRSTVRKETLGSRWP